MKMKQHGQLWSAGGKESVYKANLMHLHLLLIASEKAAVQKTHRRRTLTDKIQFKTAVLTAALGGDAKAHYPCIAGLAGIKTVFDYPEPQRIGLKL